MSSAVTVCSPSIEPATFPPWSLQPRSTQTDPHRNDARVSVETSRGGVRPGTFAVVMMAGNVPLPADQVVFEPSWSRVAGQLVDRARAGDVVMTLGAGDIAMIGAEVLDLLRAREGTGR